MPVAISASRKNTKINHLGLGLARLLQGLLQGTRSVAAPLSEPWCDMSMSHPTKVQLLYPLEQPESADVGQCSSCSQKWTQHEQQSLKKDELVKWHKYHKNEENDKVPTAHVCYKCFDTNRSNFGGMAQADLDEARRNSPKLNEKYCELRQNKVRGIKHKEVVDVKVFLQEEEEEFSEEVPEEGIFYSLVDFCDKFAEGYHFENLAQRREFIEANGYEIVQNRKGKEGVEVMELGPESYRFRRGTKNTAKKKSRRELLLTLRMWTQLSSRSQPSDALSKLKKDGVAFEIRSSRRCSLHLHSV